MGGRVGFALAKYAAPRFWSLIIGGAYPYPGDRAQFEARREMLAKGPESLVGMWDVPLSPALRSRVLANDPAVMLASWVGRMDKPGLEDVPPTMTMPCLVFVGDGDGACLGVRECVKHMPNVTFVCLSGLGHAATYFRADLVLPHITRFLAGVLC
jgi:hypothetical protein